MRRMLSEEPPNHRAPRGSHSLSGGARARFSAGRRPHREPLAVGDGRHAGRSGSHRRAADRVVQAAALRCLDRRRSHGDPRRPRQALGRAHPLVRPTVRRALAALEKNARAHPSQSPRFTAHAPAQAAATPSPISTPWCNPKAHPPSGASCSPARHGRRKQ